jgi:hypothetical protein
VVSRLIYSIRSGGQTGADRGALDTARKFKIPICGWCPKGGWAEDMTEPPGLLAKYPELKETAESNVNYRTRYNVRDSHATLIFSTDKSSPGTTLTEKHAKELNRPVFVIREKSTPQQVFNWLEDIGYDLTLNVAGPRASEAPDIYDVVTNFMSKLLRGTQ